MPIGDKNVTVFISIETNAEVQLAKTSRQIDQFAGRAERSSKRASLAFIKLGGVLRGTAGIVQRLAGRWTAMLGTIGGTFVIFKATSDAQKFGIAMAEVATIFEGTDQELAKVRQSILGLSESLGFVETIAAKGFYEIISSNITDAADAMVILSESSELAAVGLAEINDTVEVVISSIKAYGLEVEQAGRVTDILFEAVKVGRTTIPELATSLGQVLPIAATLGVELEEVAGALATLTLGGIDTNVAVIQVRQALNQLLKLTPQATATLREYGLEINATTVRQDGFAGTLFKIRDAIGDNATAFAKIFGNIRALIPVLALTGDQADEFRQVLDRIENSSGTVGRSLDKLLANPFKRFQVFLNALRLRLREVGEAFIEEFNVSLDDFGGGPAVIERLSAALEGLKEVAAAIADTFGTSIKALDDFINRQGGVEKAGEAFKALGRTIGEFGQLMATVFINVIDLGTQLLSQLPRLLNAILNDLKRFANQFTEALESLVPGDQYEVPFPEVSQSVDDLRELMGSLMADREDFEEELERLLAEVAEVSERAASKPVADARKNIEALEEKLQGFRDTAARLKAKAPFAAANVFKSQEFKQTEEALERQRKLLDGIQKDYVGAAAAVEEYRRTSKTGVRLEVEEPDLLAGLEAVLTNFRLAGGPVGERIDELQDKIRKYGIAIEQVREKENALFGSGGSSEGLGDVLGSSENLQVLEDARERLLEQLGDFKGAYDAQAKAAEVFGKALGKSTDAAQEQADTLDAIEIAPRITILQEGLTVDESQASEVLADFQKALDQQKFVVTLAAELGITLTEPSELEASVRGQLELLREEFTSETGLVLPATIDATDSEKARAAFVELNELARSLNQEIGAGAAAEIEFLDRTARVRKNAFIEVLKEIGVAVDSAAFQKLIDLFGRAEQASRFAAIGVQDFGDLIRQSAGDSAPLEAQIGKIISDTEKLAEEWASAGPVIVGGIDIIGIALANLENRQRVEIEDLLGFTGGLQAFVDDLDLERPFEEQAAAIRRANDEIRANLALLAFFTGENVSGLIKLIDDDELKKLRDLKVDLKLEKEGDPAFQFLSEVEEARKRLLDGANRLAREQTKINELTKEGTLEYRRLQRAAQKAQEEALASTKAFGIGFAAEIADIQRDLDNLFERGRRLAADLVNSIQQSFDTGISAALRGESDAFEQFKEALGNAIADTVAKAISDSLTSVVLDIGANVFGDLFGGKDKDKGPGPEVLFSLAVTTFDLAVKAFAAAVGFDFGPLAGIIGSAAGGAAGGQAGGGDIAGAGGGLQRAMGGFLTPGGNNIQQFAAGGVPERQRIQRIAGGGIVRQRSLFEVGEAGQDELVVPLPGNRKVPVEMRGGSVARSAPGPTINLTSNVSLNVSSDDRTFTDRVTQAMPVIERNITATLQQGINKALERSVQEASRGA